MTGGRHWPILALLLLFPLLLGADASNMLPAGSADAVPAFTWPAALWLISRELRVVARALIAWKPRLTVEVQVKHGDTDAPTVGPR